MHIKTVNIQGFKSYRKQDFNQEFDPKLNVIVGRNGSGKSNFFAAVSFLLSEKYTRLQAEQRQALLHEGTGRGAMTASVEIVFDNSDNRLPVTEKEVRIKRTIGLKKDEFKINDKSATTRDVTNLLESAGFSSSNPYYIVEQGKVSRLTTMKDQERLELLKEVAGTHVYDGKKNESLKILQQQETKKRTIDDSIDYVKDRLNELKSEEKELKQFRKYDSERRMIEYNIYNKQLQESIQNIERIDDERSSAFSTTTLINEQRLDLQQNLRRLERDISDTKSQLVTKRKQRENEEEERQRLLREITKCKLNIGDQGKAQKSNDQTKQKQEADLQNIKAEIRSTEEELKKLEYEFAKKSEEERKIQGELDNLKRRQNQLFAKSGRTDQFKSQQERDTYLKQEIEKRKDQTKHTSERITRVNKAIENLQKKSSTNQDEAKKTKGTIEILGKETESQEKRLKEISTEKERKVDERKIQRRKQYETITEIQQLTNMFEKQKRDLEITRSRDITRGIDVVEEIVRQRNISGYHGPVIDLIKVNPRYHLAAEATAGNSLFHLVVENSGVAKQIIETMNNTGKRGRITFIPLEELTPKVDRVEVSETEAVPLVNKVDTKFKKIAKQLFGRTYVSNSIETAAEVAKTFNVDCVTLDGDRVDKKGTLQGGYVEAKRIGRLQAQENLRKAQDDREYALENKSKIDDILTQLEKDITNFDSEKAQIEAKMRSNENSIHASKQKLLQIEEFDGEAKETLPKLQSALANLKKNIDSWKKDCDAFENELHSPFTSGLSNQEEKELTELIPEISKLSDDVEKQQQDLAKIEGKIDSLRYKIRSNLIPRRQNLLDNLSNSVEAPVSKESINQERKKLEQLKDDLDDATSRLETLDNEIDSLQENVDKKQSSTETERQELEKKLARLQKKDTSLERLLNERKIYLEKREESIKAIRELGSIPQEHERFADHTGKELLDMLHSVKEELKKYQHVNQKALDQLEEYKIKYKEFSKKKKELDREDRAIRDLIKILDRRKHEVITRTYKQVSQHFSEMFKRLAAGGNAELQLTKFKDGDMEDGTEDDADQYSGVAIKTRFPGNAEEQLMQQLSGGQKTVVALALIFAIQKCDPAPFYLLDEIDSALDPTYRKAIAELIKQQAEESNIQFIVTTFKTELVNAANQHFGIKFQNKVSQISAITKSKALSILAEEERAIEEAKS